MSLVRVIGFFGLKNAGKDEAAKALIKHGWKNAVVYKFATPLKKMAAALLGVDQSLLNGDSEESRAFREEEHPALSAMTGGKIKTPRYLLQWMGTEAFRGLHKEIWVQHLEQRIHNYALRVEGAVEPYDVFITDCRFENEMAMVKRLGGKCVRIDREGLENTDGHASEAMPFKEEDFDIIIKNDGKRLLEFHWQVADKVNQLFRDT